MPHSLLLYFFYGIHIFAVKSLHLDISFMIFCARYQVETDILEYIKGLGFFLFQE